MELNILHLAKKANKEQIGNKKLECGCRNDFRSSNRIGQWCGNHSFKKFYGSQDPGTIQAEKYIYIGSGVLNLIQMIFSILGLS